MQSRAHSALVHTVYADTNISAANSRLNVYPAENMDSSIRILNENWFMCHRVVSSSCIAVRTGLLFSIAC